MSQQIVMQYEVKFCKRKTTYLRMGDLCNEQNEEALLEIECGVEKLWLSIA